MKKRRLRKINLIMTAGLTAALVLPFWESAYAVEAKTINQIQNEINNTKNELEGINGEIDRLSDEQDVLEEKIADLNSEIINTMASISMKEEEIAKKQEELEDKQQQIEVTRQEYEAAKAREDKQYADMLVRIKLMYEYNSTNYLGQLLAGEGLSDMLNRMDYIESVYEYDRKKLQEFEETKNQVHELWDCLETEKTALEQDKSSLEADKADLELQKGNLDTMLVQKKRESADYDAEIAKAKKDAAAAKKRLKQEQDELKRIQEEQKKANTPGNTAAATGSYSATGYTETIDNAAGSDLGKRVAKYACQYIGNPYVSGGTSLTNGADCSGFIYRVYSDFGYTLPRTSYQQRSAGTGVDYSAAQPGDIICYEGHVGIYIGGGMIVHASSAKTGIKVSRATYREILSVRRII